jgi:hypothetical protein
VILLTFRSLWVLGRRTKLDCVRHGDGVVAMSKKWSRWRGGCRQRAGQLRKLVVEGSSHVVLVCAAGPATVSLWEFQVQLMRAAVKGSFGCGIGVDVLMFQMRWRGPFRVVLGHGWPSACKRAMT